MLRWAGPLILALASVFALVAGLVLGGGAAAQALQDPGAFVRWSVPVAKLIVNIAGSVMLGSLVIALFALAPKERAFSAALDAASISAALFTVASGATTFLTYMSTLNPRLSLSREFGEQLGRFLTESEAGQAWLIQTIAGGIVTVLAFAVRSWLGVLITAGLAAVSLIPMATASHKGDLAGHDLVVMAISLHTLGAALWLGGLVALVVVRVPCSSPSACAPCSSDTRRSRSSRSSSSRSRGSCAPSHRSDPSISW